MIVGIGIDVVGVERFEEVLSRTPGVRERLFTPSEREMPLLSLAGRFAAKEALAKSLGSPPGMSWQDACISRGAHGAPSLAVSGTVQARADELGVAGFHLSISHDAGVAVAVVVAHAGT
ncbi:holo-ACP synthase [Gephyromycinifex aptenodytis]|uniref:holo-ACP synthase n=1 Tax=Gephyromycinifex aptenodytis TaxID=2716227 RepID=UPI0014457C92|nr:holo-ACP synthase [Gephyromycinifex aptenodytis]